MKYFILSSFLFLTSCCDNCYSIIPPLRPIPNCEQHQPTGLKMPCKVYRCK